MSSMPARRFREGGSSPVPRRVVLEPVRRPSKVHPATQKQLDLIEHLLDERDLRASSKVDPKVKSDPEAYVQTIMVLKQTSKNLSKSTASLWIDRLLELPYIEPDSLGELGRWRNGV